MMSKKKYSDSDWEMMARELQEGSIGESGTLNRFIAEDNADIIKHWNNIAHSEEDRIADTAAAWERLEARINMSESAGGSGSYKSPSRYYIFKYAAAFAVLVALAAMFMYLNNRDYFSASVTQFTDAYNKNLVVTLPDGSTVTLNRDTKITYKKNFGKSARTLSLEGEAFFDVVPDSDKPFIISAGRAAVEVVGTSFNVLTGNSSSAIEVLVKTGLVKLSDNESRESILLEPGYVGSIELNKPVKSLNNDVNYMAWNTGILIYDGQPLDIVFRDLRKVYNINVITADPSILNETWVSPPIDNMPEETIIQLICGSFNLSYVKDGENYRLAKK